MLPPVAGRDAIRSARGESASNDGEVTLHRAEDQREPLAIELGGDWRLQHGIPSADPVETALAERMGVTIQLVNTLINGKRGISANTALRLGRLLKTSPQFWMRLQADWELQLAQVPQPGRRKLG